MKNLWKDVWETLNTPIEFPLMESSNWIAHSGEALLALAEELRGSQNTQLITSRIGSLNSLLDILDLPIVRLSGSLLPFIPIATEILKYISDKLKKSPSLEVCTAIVSQVAYLECLKSFLDEIISEVSQEFLDTSASRETRDKILNFGRQLNIKGNPFEFSAKEAEKAIICFHHSKLSSVFGEILYSRLNDLGLSEKRSKLLTEKVSRSTFRYMTRGLSEIGQSIPRLSSIIGGDWKQDLRIHHSLDDYLSQEISPGTTKRDWQVFNEFYADKPEIPVLISDLYVPLKSQISSSNSSQPENLESIALSLIEEQDKVLLLHGDPGRGKSVFCRIFADWIRENRHPIWTPILIKLSHVVSLEDGFEEILEKAIGREFATGNWLTDRNTRFLFLLDGFDDLLLKQKENHNLQDFLWKVKYFQDDCNRNPIEKGHRVLITSRPVLFQGLYGHIPSEIEIIDILPFDQNQQNKWIQN